MADRSRDSARGGDVQEEGASNDLSETTRLETFADGVMAIAITLLVIEVRVPSHEAVDAAGGLTRALLARWPSYLGYLISFVTIGIMWVNHHAMFQYIRRVDRTFLMLHVFFLLSVAFVPFPTAVLAEFLTEEHARRPAAVLYGAWFVIVALAYNAVWRYGIAGGRLLGEHVDPEAVRTITRRYRLGPVLYLVATLLALLNVALSLAVHFSLALLFALPERSRQGAAPSGA